MLSAAEIVSQHRLAGTEIARWSRQSTATAHPMARVDRLAGNA
jgi:hypothetical protein